MPVRPLPDHQNRAFRNASQTCSSHAQNTPLRLLWCLPKPGAGEIPLHFLEQIWSPYRNEKFGIRKREQKVVERLRQHHAGVVENYSESNHFRRRSAGSGEAVSSLFRVWFFLAGHLAEHPAPTFTLTLLKREHIRQLYSPVPPRSRVRNSSLLQ